MGESEHRLLDGDEGFAVSPAEQRLWLLRQLEPRDPSYHVCLALGLRGRANPMTLLSTVAAIERRNQVLRSRYLDHDDGVLRRHVHVTHPPAMPLVDVAGAGAVDAIVSELARRPFDLTHGPLTRWTLLRVDPRHHILVLAVHHIVFDGGSLPALCAELTSLARALADGVATPAAPTPAAPTAPASQAVERGGADLDYWRRCLANPPAPVSIWPPDADAGAVDLPEAAAVTVSTALEPDVVDRLRRFARTRAATPAMVMLAALGATVARYTGRDDIVVGTPVSLRETPEDWQSIGLRLNLLPLRLRLRPAITFDVLVTACRDAFLDGIEHRRAPFESIVDAVGAERSYWHSPLFQVLFAHQRSPRPPSLPDVTVELMAPPTPGAKYHLSMTATETDGGITVAFDADARQCHPSALQAFSRHYATLLLAAITDAALPIERLPLVTEGPRRYRRRAEHTAGPAHPASLDLMVERTAAARPDAVAAYCPDGQLTYAALDRRANQLAHELRAEGAGPDRIVGVCLRRTPDLLVALLAVAKAGAAYLPLDPQLPRERLRVMLADARACLLVTDSALAEEWEHQAAVVLADASTVSLRPASRPPASSVHPANLAYVLYTSGSSGLPKGVAISHASVTGFLRWAAREFEGEACAAVIALTSIGFDLSVFELFAPLVAGGAIVLVDGPSALNEHPVAGRATLLNTVPSVLEALLDAGSLPAGLRAVNLAGERLSRDLVTRLLAQAPTLAVRNLYGPSEATTYVTAARLEGGDREPSIGRAVAGAQLWLVDATGAPVPIGVGGTILVGGPPLARGYLRRPALTAQAFVPDHLGHAGGGRLYRTGDVAREGNDGELWFRGRIDHQIKLRGVRMELEEIESLLREHHAVRDAAVVLTGDVLRDHRLVAFICPTREAPAPAELAAHLRERVSAVMTPTAWSMLADLPRTPNGKLDRRLLAQAAKAVGAAQSGSAPPRSPLEVAIARAWCDVLGRPNVGVHDGFFDLGGTSLLLLRLHAVLRKRIEPHLRAVDLFRWPTVASLARHLRDRPPAPTISARPDDDAIDDAIDDAADDAADAGQRSGVRRRAMAGQRRRHRAER